VPARWFICPDGHEIEIQECLKNGGCRLKNRCATRPYLRLIGFDREWKGVSPSSAGNGPRLLYLKATEDYSIDPNDRVWAAFGTSTHDKLGMFKYTHNVLSEERLSDEDMRGIPDVLEEDEDRKGFYILTDYKTWGSFKVTKALGMKTVKETIELKDDDGEPLLLKSGPNKGKPKTKQESKIIQGEPDLISEELQINRYRIFFEGYGFPISRMQIQVVSRDGGTYIAKNRGIDKNLYVIPVRFIDDSKVLTFYQILQTEIDKAFETGTARLCDKWESWEGRRCDGYCEVSEYCKQMEGEHGEPKNTHGNMEQAQAAA